MFQFHALCITDLAPMPHSRDESGGGNEPGTGSVVSWLLSKGPPRDKDVEILALRHQIAALERRLGKTRPRFLLESEGTGSVEAQVRRPVTSRAMIVFMISDVPPYMVCTRASVKARAIGYSAM